MVVVQPSSLDTEVCCTWHRNTNRKHMHSCRDIAPGTQGSTMLLVCNLSPFLAPHPLISFWLVTGDVQKASNNTPQKETASIKIIKHQLSQSSRQYGLFGGPQVIATCFSKSLLLFGGQRAIKPPGVTCLSVTKNLDIFSPRSHGKNPDQCILMCSHVNNNIPMFTTISKFLSQRNSMILWHSLASLISSTLTLWCPLPRTLGSTDSKTSSDPGFTAVNQIQVILLRQPSPRKMPRDDTQMQLLDPGTTVIQ